MLLREHGHSNIKRIQEEVQVRNYTIKSFTSLGSWEELKQHKECVSLCEKQAGCVPDFSDCEGKKLIWYSDNTECNPMEEECVIG